MKRKYYLRGMGTGIIITALVFITALFLNPSSMTDAEIKQKPAEMGMVDKEALMDEPEEEDTAVADAGDETLIDAAEGEEQTEAEAEEGEESSGDKAKDKVKEKKEEETQEEEEDPEKPKDDTKVTTTTDEDGNTTRVEQRTGHDVTPAPDERTSPVQEGSSSGETVSFTISGGQNSRVVGNNLASAGLVDDGTAFDHFLEENGYDRIIRPGSYDIPEGASYEEIARIITGGR